MKRRNFFSGLLAAFAAPAAVPVPTGRTIHCNDAIAPFVDVIDKRTGKRIDLVKSVNVEEGWLERYMTDERGRVVVLPSGTIRAAVVNGEPHVAWTDSVVPTETIRGEFVLRYKSKKA